MYENNLQPTFEPLCLLWLTSFQPPSSERNFSAANSGVISRCGFPSISKPTMNLRTVAERRSGGKKCAWKCHSGCSWPSVGRAKRSVDAASSLPVVVLREEADAVPLARALLTAQVGDTVTLFDNDCCEITGAGEYLPSSRASRGLKLRLDTSAYSSRITSKRKYAKALERGPRWRPTKRPARGFRKRHPVGF